jgi:hypothetical protein
MFLGAKEVFFLGTNTELRSDFTGGVALSVHMGRQILGMIFLTSPMEYSLLFSDLDDDTYLCIVM